MFIMSHIYIAYVYYIYFMYITNILYVYKELHKALCGIVNAYKLLSDSIAKQSVSTDQSCLHPPSSPPSSAVFLCSLHSSEAFFFLLSSFWVSSLLVTKVPSCSLSLNLQTTFNRYCLPSTQLAVTITHQIEGILRRFRRIGVKCGFAQQFKNRITNISL